MNESSARTKRTARERARAEMTEAIKAEARNQLGTVGAGGLSLRAVARELGVVSSAVYRYFPNRDALLTALLIDAFNALGAAAEKGVQQAGAQTEPRASLRAFCAAVRSWARQHPNEYALIHGSPVPGYAAPQDTVVPATRVPLALMGLLRDALAAGWLVEPHTATAPQGALAEQLGKLAAEYSPQLSTAVIARAIMAWSQLFGMVSFELFGSFVGSVDPADEFFSYAVERMGDALGLVS